MVKLKTFITPLLIAAGLTGSFGTGQEQAMAGQAMAPRSAYDFTFVGIDGQAMPLSQWQGKVILLVNTASQCGLTPQYRGLQALYERYKDQGLVVLGVPSNDFGGQEPGNAQEIQEFCSSNFHVTFPMTDKVSVKGDLSHPFYVWAAGEVGPLATPRWNFHKYLISADGRLIDWFSSVTTPDDPKISRAIEAALGKP